MTVFTVMDTVRALLETVTKHREPHWNASMLCLMLQVRCNCVECVSSSDVDSLRHSRSRLNIYKALSSPSLIALSSEDPFLTAFRLSWELQELSKVRSWKTTFDLKELKYSLHGVLINLYNTIRWHSIAFPFICQVIISTLLSVNVIW